MRMIPSVNLTKFSQEIAATHAPAIAGAPARLSRLRNVRQIGSSFNNSDAMRHYLTKFREDLSIQRHRANISPFLRYPASLMHFTP
jgi:hypothetical protein